ncbi:endo alpha-1,4 polygalactosaminidase [Nocardiopsis lambiniae]|uniref:Endo alpha-1,4 polygalactosaminidase n=1 Tax=Nocardiopsis lambiniae TaxID=3075539 RepID=A0ABU2MBC3_9ACTN|nr:endo alpha-1,4 polygalactosaminidase [Nocardiopsis sp. DSM 44743]MDT0329904.1 endo alpha-1,4 polygalactosaminidase [Nocardiopsis sp. DSM 44743]
MRVSLVTGLAASAVAVVVAGCAPTAELSAHAEPEGLPNGWFDYQLGGGYPPPEDVGIVVRDSTDEPEPGMYSICYVNGFQTQPGEERKWLDEGLVLLDEAGEPVIDPGWPDERLLDTSTDEKRGRIAALLGATIEGCADDGFAAVEFDNLDSYLRSQGWLTVEDNFALAEELVAIVHDHGLLAAQKNAAEETERGREAGFDFAITESCAAWFECDAYTSVYGDEGVLDIEYPDTLENAGLTFEDVCADPESPSRTILRDLDLVPEGAEGYLYERC